ncbi:hypothetical protein IV203_009015 [Nitzschia inconspicua]|uniref:Uncharacterized protein n=1 Tax=Nitzschia inconspicua TaxID=303405 RepID=A0A9K3L014_9STRA|nr:hypothetical protein IV203_009015 [Nitzschia inconspicua]
MPDNFTFKGYIAFVLWGPIPPPEYEGNDDFMAAAYAAKYRETLKADGRAAARAWVPFSLKQLESDPASNCALAIAMKGTEKKAPPLSSKLIKVFIGIVFLLYLQGLLVYWRLLGNSHHLDIETSKPLVLVVMMKLL